MSVLSYLVTSRPGCEERLLKELRALPWAEVIPSSSHQLSILVVDTPDDASAGILQERLNHLEFVAHLALVFGEMPFSQSSASQGDLCDA